MLVNSAGEGSTCSRLICACVGEIVGQVQHG